MGKVKEHIPVRTCIACGAKQPKKDLLRFVLLQENRVVNDQSGGLPGRGAYVCNDNACLNRAIEKKCLNRAFRKKGALSMENLDGMGRN